MGRYGRPLSLDAEFERADSEDTSTILDYLGQEDSDLRTLADRLDLIEVDPKIRTGG